jgi:hypothetical protein
MWSLAGNVRGGVDCKTSEYKFCLAPALYLPELVSARYEIPSTDSIGNLPDLMYSYSGSMWPTAGKIAQLQIGVSFIKHDILPIIVTFILNFRLIDWSILAKKIKNNL